MKSHKTVLALCEGAIMVAAATVLSFLKLWEMPFGGAVVLSMIPMIFYSVRWGVGAGLSAGLAFGALQFIFDGGFAIGWQSILGDYLLAFAALGFAGLAKGRRGAPFLGTALGCFARFLVHWAVGATVWAEYMPESFLGLSMENPWFYSFLYNGLYMLPNAAVTAAVFLLIAKPLKSYLMAEDL